MSSEGYGDDDNDDNNNDDEYTDNDSDNAKNEMMYGVTKPQRVN